jgi:pimeloyl-ACP methyl ester carboxylesterase
MRNFLSLLATLSISLALTAAPPDAEKSATALAELRAAVDGKPSSLTDLAGKPFAKVPLTKADSAKARDAIVAAYIANFPKERKAEHAAKVLKDDKLEMPYTVTEFGKKPATGHSLWISLHGGGGAPKAVNDQQWENQKKLYKLEEGFYVTPRAPTNTWNLWHEGHIDRLFAKLIENFIALEGVNPDRVYVLGYSAGGDGVYQLAPRLADRWAGAAMMAGHPNDASPLNLRNVAFALQVGGKDTAYNRNQVAAEWGKKLDDLEKADPKGYKHFFKSYEGKGHWMNREDAVALPWMAKVTRNPIPETVVWEQRGGHERSYWLAAPKGEAKGGTVIATLGKQKVTIGKLEKTEQLMVRLDDRMVDLDSEVIVEREGIVLLKATPVRTAGTLLRTLAERGDPQAMFDAELQLNFK